MLFLDFNSGAPLCYQAKEVLFSFLNSQSSFYSKTDSQFPSNPSSIHSFGRKAKRHFAQARENIAASLGNKVDPEQLIFTSCGSEANQLAIRSYLEPAFAKHKHPQWITTEVEHDSVMQMVKWFEDKGGKVIYLPIDQDGAPIIDALDDLYCEQTALVSCVWVNNETGVITDVNKLSQKVKSLGGVLHLDGAQAWGKIPFCLNEIDASLVTFTGHKIGALSGTGVLWVNKGVKVNPVILGKQEKTRRGGTENLLGVISMGAAAKKLAPAKWHEQVKILRDRLQDEVIAQIPGVQINGLSGQNDLRVGNTLNLLFEGIEGEGLVLALDLEGYAVSAGSACSSGVLEPSHVLMALGRNKQQAMSAIRVSLSPEIKWEQLELFVESLKKVVQRMRQSKVSFKEL